MQSVNQALDKLKGSKFRSSFHLSRKDREYVIDKGYEVLERHARDFVGSKLSPANPINDGKQTPMSGHPIFKAMHACGCCCRGCLNKWYRVPMNIELSDVQQDKIVHLLLSWVKREMDAGSGL